MGSAQKKRPWWKSTTLHGLIIGGIGEGMAHVDNPWIMSAGWCIRYIGAGIAAWGIRTHGEKTNT
jgi:protein-S-isoprenylcysteine O-methyltransferase Ste14